VLDTGPLGLVTHPKGGAEAMECKEWMKPVLTDGCRVIVVAISDYELRRELIRGARGDCILASQSWNVHKVVFKGTIFHRPRTDHRPTNPRHPGRFATAMH